MEISTNSTTPWKEGINKPLHGSKSNKKTKKSSSPHQPLSQPGTQALAGMSHTGTHFFQAELTLD